jgi:ribosomal protein S12 methylthiotransferase accessory factor
VTAFDAAPLERLVEYLVDDHVGILSAIAPTRVHAAAPSFFHYVAHPCDTSAFTNYIHSGPRGAAAADRRTAVSRVLTDGVSAYCAALISEEDAKAPFCAAADAPLGHLAPDELALFSAEQYARADFPYAPFTDQTVVQWTEAVDPLTYEPVLIPAALRFLPYAPATGRGEAAIAPSTSIGLACHWDAAAAAVQAICDVAECDALARAWYSGAALPHVRVETLSDANYELVTRFERTGASLQLLRLDAAFGLASVLAVLSSREPSAPALVFAAGTDPDPEVAVCRSVEMLAHVQHYCQLVRTQLPPPATDDDVRDQSDHLAFWADHGNASRAAFLLSSRERIEFDELPKIPGSDAAADLERLLRAARDAGQRVLLANLTTPDVADTGLTVVRAVIAGMQPLFFGSSTAAFGGTRIDAARAAAAPPHPFPRRGVNG